MSKTLTLSIVASIILAACSGGSKKSDNNEEQRMFTGTNGEVKLITLDPGHFHAALVQKTMYDMVNPEVHIYAPEGPELEGHLKLIESYNSRSDNPTSWETVVYKGPDYLEKMLEEKPGNVVVLAGNNSKKTDYLLESVKAGLNVLSDKPMVINPEGYSKLEEAFEMARNNGVLLYDIMTERYEITTIMQRTLAHTPEVFGTLQAGSVEEPAITKESIHHFSKQVSGNPLIRPSWYFDVQQQGEGIVDVTTHLVDLIQWEAFPEVTLKKEDVEILTAKRWSTDLTLPMFSKVTQMNEFPEFLEKDVEEGVLKVFSNGEMNYRLKGIHAKVSVIWDFEAPEGSGDTHYSIMRGSKCNLIIKQGKEENFVPTLYVEAVNTVEEQEFEAILEDVINNDIQVVYPGIKLNKINHKIWEVVIPPIYREGHEAHFGQVTEKYLRFLSSGEMPEWEVPNMLVKYYTITEAMKTARE